MASIEARLSDQQKRNLEEARRLLGLRSRSELLFWFADNAVEIAQGQLTGIGFIEQQTQELLGARRRKPGK